MRDQLATSAAEQQRLNTLVATSSAAAAANAAAEPQSALERLLEALTAKADAAVADHQKVLDWVYRSHKIITTSYSNQILELDHQLDTFRNKEKAAEGERFALQVQIRNLKKAVLAYQGRAELNAICKFFAISSIKLFD